MAKVRELPPPPRSPEVAPPARVTGEEEITIETHDGEPALEARVRAPRGATRGVLFCHPHPLYGGTMHSAVVLAIARTLAERGGDEVAHLRFNYRGAGASAGAYDDGRGETRDVGRALAELRRRAPAARLSLCGYSFGTWVGLRAASTNTNTEVERVVLVAPAVRVFDFIPGDARRFGGAIHVFAGDRDDFCDVEEARSLAADLGAGLTIVEGADHFFMSSRRRLAEAAYPHLVPEGTA